MDDLQMSLELGGVFLDDATLRVLETYTKPVVVHVRRETCDVYIGRTPFAGRPISKWANPYVIGRDGDRATVLAKYEELVRSTPALLEALPELRGKRLGCWCRPEKCHGDVLAKLVEEFCTSPVDIP